MMSKLLLIDSAVRTIIGGLGFILNSLQMSCILKKTPRKLPFDLTLLSLSIADLITAVALLAFGIYDVLEIKKIVRKIAFFETINEAALDLSIVTSLIHVEYIAIQRLFAVLFPIKFQIMFTKFRCKLGLVLIWIICAGYCMWNSWEKINNTPSFIIMSYTTIASICFLLLSYLTICLIICRKSQLSSTRNRRNYAIFFNSLLVSTAFLVCTLPFTLQTLNVIRSDTFYQFIIPKWILFLNIILDPIIYFLLKQYRNRKRTCLSCLHGRHRESHKNQLPLLTVRKSTQKTTIKTKDNEEPDDVV